MSPTASDVAAMPSHTLSGDETVESPEFDAPPEDPIALLRGWLRQAAERRVREPAAAVLATADAAGRPSSRVVLLKEIDGDGLVFTTHLGSRKGRDLAVNPWGSMTFYWRETLQQITVAGRVERLADRRADELFAERPVAAQATTAVSEQGQPLADEQALHVAAAALAEKGEALARPVGWGGYRLLPDAIEFWHGRASRLHRRLAYTRVGVGWAHQRLQP